jgi:hypothetical protein
MNDLQIFILCSSGKLVIFDTKALFGVNRKPLSVISTNADQMQLLSTNHLIFFDSLKRFIYQYETAELKKVESHALPQQLEAGLKMICDDTKRCSFYNSKVIKYISIELD